MKTIKIRFLDFATGFCLERFFLYQWLQAHYEVVLSDTPDYVVFSCFGEEHLRYNDCVKIFYTGECQTPDFNLCDYALGFDYMDFGDRYLRYPLYFSYHPAYEYMLTKHTLSEEQIASKKDFCAFVCSNHRGSEQRIRFFELLHAVRKVDSGGKLLNNIGGPVHDKLAFQATHRWSIAFENTSYPGYTTEKIVESFASGNIPIYYGDPRVVQDFNPNAFVNCADFDSFEQVVERVLEIDDNPALYRQYLREPALRNPTLREQMMAQLDTFLTHIFDQDKEQAKRYNRTYWGLRLVRERQKQYYVYSRTWRVRLRQFYVRHFYQKSRNNPFLWRLTKILMKMDG